MDRSRVFKIPVYSHVFFLADMRLTGDMNSRWTPLTHSPPADEPAAGAASPDGELGIGEEWRRPVTWP